MAKKLSINRFQYSAGIILLVLAFSLGIWVRAYGEQVGGAPESGSTSHISSLYTALQSSGFGSDADTPDWGATWNRIKTSAQWTPNGTATASDVASGKTFYGSDRTQNTGTLTAPGNCPTQEHQDSYGAPITQTTNCTDTVAWTVPSGSIAGSEKQDNRTGLIWSNLVYKSSNTAIFSLSSGTDWSWNATLDNNVAVGGKTAITLCSSMGDGWRLPTQKELQQAYIDGSFFNLSQSVNSFWSSTSYNGDSSWLVALSDGFMVSSGQSNTSHVRCVR
ncbi:MAG: DUF1566 domain-containing protein [Candidatus Saccharibacteria bacterium]